jgi:hypothetical protein
MEETTMLWRTAPATLLCTLLLAAPAAHAIGITSYQPTNVTIGTPI